MLLETIAMALVTVTAERAPGGAGPQAPRVTANAREVRIVFPPDTARAWGWPDISASPPAARYTWRVNVRGIGGAATIWWTVGRDYNGARSFSSLRQLVDAGKPELCTGASVIVRCTSSGVRASVDGRHVVLALVDSVAIR